MSVPDMLVNHEVLQHTCEAIFQRAGLPDEQAQLVAASLIAADLRGVHSHGVLMVARML